MPFAKSDKNHSLRQNILFKYVDNLAHIGRDNGNKRLNRSQSLLIHRPEAQWEPKSSLSQRETEFRHLPPRHRSLTLQSKCEESNIWTADQEQSALFKLPKELRQSIYKQVIGNSVLHIVRRPDKLGHKRCKTNGEPDDCLSTRCRGFKLDTGLYIGCDDGNLLQLLQSCRKTYSEGIGLLYSSNTFDFDSLESFVSFSCSILSRRLDSISSLQLDFRFSQSYYFAESTPRNDWPRWERTWRIIATMQSLQKIKMRILWPAATISEDEEEELLQPLRLVKDLKVFDVNVPWPRQNGIEEWDNTPFHIERPTMTDLRLSKRSTT